MYLKIAGAALVIGTAYFIGHNQASFYRRRVRQLEELLLALEIFRSEVNYGLLPLPQAFYRIGRSVTEPVGNLFSETAELLEQGKGLSAKESWLLAVGSNLYRLDLGRQQEELVDRLGQFWGRGDKNGQLKQLQYMQELIRQALNQARAERKNGEKIWKSLGLLGGITLVIFLL